VVVSEQTDTAMRSTQSPNALLTVARILGSCTSLLTKATYSPSDDGYQVIFSKPRRCKSPSKFCCLSSPAGGTEAQIISG